MNFVFIIVFIGVHLVISVGLGGKIGWQYAQKKANPKANISAAAPKIGLIWCIAMAAGCILHFNNILFFFFLGCWALLLVSFGISNWAFRAYKWLKEHPPHP